MSDLNPYAQDGYKANDNLSSPANTGHPENLALRSSAVWMAFELGVWLRDNNRGTPYDVAMSRGYSLKCRISGEQPQRAWHRFAWIDTGKEAFVTFKEIVG